MDRRRRALSAVEQVELRQRAIDEILAHEQGRSQGTVQTVNSILGVVRLKLGVVRRPRQER